MIESKKDDEIGGNRNDDWRREIEEGGGLGGKE